MAGFDIWVILEKEKTKKKKNIQIPSNLLMWPPVLRDHLSKVATFSGSLEPKYSVNEPVLRGHLS